MPASVGQMLAAVNDLVIERFGLPGLGAHSADSEYVLVDAIEPRRA